MSYLPKVIPRGRGTLDLEDVLQSRYWHGISFKEIKKNDRILVVRISGGTRILMESVVLRFDYTKSAWLNSEGTPVVSAFDSRIFRAGVAPDGQSEDYSDLMLGG